MKFPQQKAKIYMTMVIYTVMNATTIILRVKKLRKNKFICLRELIISNLLKYGQKTRNQIIVFREKVKISFNSTHFRSEKKF